MDNRPIGVFDSGFGGLTAVRALRRLLPEEDIVFFADNGRAPYGSRPAEQLRRMARQDVELLLARGVKLIVAACGTVSSNAAEVLRAAPVPVIGMIEAPVEAIRAAGGAGAIGVIATEATVRAGAFAAALRAACPGREVLSVACPDFVPLIESGHIRPDDPDVAAAAERYLAPLREREIGTLLLGCTHYGLIAPAIRACLGGGVRLVEASACAAVSAAERLRGSENRGGGTLRCLTSGDLALFTALAPLLLGEEITPEAEALPPMEA